MTAEEIKKTYSMTDILSRYGISVRHGMCGCPFHGIDRHPSMQVFKDGFKCHTCNEHGDIFDFVMLKERCSFKDAFISLGGTYEHKDTKKKQTLILKAVGLILCVGYIVFLNMFTKTCFSLL